MSADEHRVIVEEEELRKKLARSEAFVHIAVSDNVICALDAGGRVWRYDEENDQWQPLSKARRWP